MARSKGKPKKPTATQRERKRVQQFIRRAEKRGYIFDPELKASIKTAKYQTLKSYTPEKLYKKSEYVVKRDTQQYASGEIITGTKGRQLERKISAQKGAVTQVQRYAKKEGAYVYTDNKGRLRATKDPVKAVNERQKRRREKISETRSDLDRIAEQQAEEIKEAIDAEDIDEIDLDVDTGVKSRAIDFPYRESTQGILNDIEEMLDRVGAGTSTLGDRMTELQEQLDIAITDDELERIWSQAHDLLEQTIGYVEYEPDRFEDEEFYEDYSDWAEAETEPDLAMPFKDLTQEDYEVYGRVLEMIQTSDEKGAQILDKIISNAISKYGEEEVVKTFAEFDEDTISDMQFAIHYETDINGGRVFSKIAKTLYGITGERVSNEMNREIGRAMDTM